MKKYKPKLIFSQELCKELDAFEKLNWFKKDTTSDPIGKKFLETIETILLAKNNWFI